MTSVQRWSHSDLPAALRWQAVAFIRTAWPEIEAGMVREPYPGSVEPTYYTVCHDADLLLSMAAVYTTSVSVADQVLRATCLGNVFTFPAARRRGLGRRVVDAATRDIRASSVDVAALLCDPSLRQFYEASGWQAVPASPTITDQGEVVEALRMMLLVSSKASAGTRRWETEPMRVPSAW